VAALHWVKENIRAFGGDVDLVTLLGHGHGAALVNILLVSPITKGIRALKYFLSFKLAASKSYGASPAIWDRGLHYWNRHYWW